MHVGEIILLLLLALSVIFLKVIADVPNRLGNSKFKNIAIITKALNIPLLDNCQTENFINELAKIGDDFLESKNKKSTFKVDFLLLIS